MINRQAIMPQYTWDLDAIRLGGQEMATAQQLLEHPEEVLDQPPQAIQLTDEFGGKIEAIRGDPQKAVAVRPGAAARSLRVPPTDSPRSGTKSPP
jgi:hypothetical protein